MDEQTEKLLNTIQQRLTGHTNKLSVHHQEMCKNRNELDKRIMEVRLELDELGTLKGAIEKFGNLPVQPEQL